MPVRRHPVAEFKSNSPLKRLPLDLPLLGRLRATHAQVCAQERRLAELFYARLFAAAPHLRPLFRGDMAIQAQKLTAALDAVVANFERPGANAQMLADLGKRHAGYGARPEHYGLVIDLLVESMREVLGPSADGRALDEWRTALDLIGNQMIAAAGPPVP